MKKDVITYEIDGKLYINLTNRCCNDCVFCLRNYEKDAYGYDLWLEKEPTADEILSELTNLDKYSEIVFCGFGEPTYRLTEIIMLAKFIKSKGIKTRLNTNGLGNLINERDITEELVADITTVSISLNATNADDYQKICKSVYGAAAFPALIEFAKNCVLNGGNVVMSVVDTIGAEEIEKSREIARKLGAMLRVRELIGE